MHQYHDTTKASRRTEEHLCNDKTDTETIKPTFGTFARGLSVILTDATGQLLLYLLYQYDGNLPCL